MKRFIVVVFIILLSSLLPTSMTRSTVIHYTLEDEVESKSFVGSLARDTPQLRTRNDTNHEYRLPGLHFLFLSSPHSHFFHLDGSSGDLYTASKMDRDVICSSSASECQLELNVQIKAEHFSSFVKVLIKMKDSNDNSPVFSKQSVHLNLSEAEIVGRKVRLVHVSDADGPENGIKRFLLRPEEEEFGLHYNNNTRDGLDGQGHFEIFLVVRKPLDRELRSTYQLNLIAEDHGDPPRKAVLPLTIVLSDVNDNAPVFEKEVYHAVVEENSPIGTSVIHVLAKDDDLGDAGEVIYGLEKKLNPRRTTAERQGGQSSHFYEEQDEEWNVWMDEEIGGPLFRIDRGTGLIYVSGSLDREKVSQHVLSVSARDLTSSRSKSVSLVKIEVSDVNDNPPMISSQFSVYNVTENCGPRTFVGLLTVSDLDSPENTRLSCSTDNPIFVLEPIISNQYQLVTSSDEKHLLLDRESQKEYQILITCTDGSFPSLTGSLSLSIQVLDRNDNKPKFEAANYSIRLLENYLPDGAVIRAIASDEDEGANGMVRYRLEALPDTWYPRESNPENGQLSLPGFNPSTTSILSHFEINEKTGALKVIKPFDREQVPMVKLLFAAYDLGTPPQTSHADVIIFIDDVDDEKPTFTRSNFTFTVLENQPPGSLVGTVQAYDADETPFNSFHYFIHRSDIFRVDPSSGSLTTLVSLDRELIDFYVFDIFACPTSGEDDCTSAHVTVRIADENDNTPRLIFPAAHLNFTLVVTNSFQYGDKVTKIMAEDDDEPGPNSRLLFQAVDTTYFRLNSTSGMVTASRTFAVSGEGSICEFPVVIRDSGDPPKSLEVSVIFIFNSSVKSYFDLERENNEGNFYIVICIAVASAFLSTILVIAILFVARKQTLPPSCDVDKKSERTRAAGKKKKENKSNGKNSNSASLKLRCQQPLPAKGGKNKNNKTKRKKSSKEPMNTCSDAPFTLNNGCLRNKNKGQSLEEPFYTKGEETDHIGSSSKLTHFPNLTMPSQDRLMEGDGDLMFVQNIPKVVDKTSSMHQTLISKQRYVHNPVSATTLTTNKLPTRPQVPVRSSGTMTLGCYGDRVPHHVNNSFRQAPTEVKFKPELVTKDPHYFTNCAASASLPQPSVCYPSSEAKLTFGSFV